MLLLIHRSISKWSGGLYVVTVQPAVSKKVALYFSVRRRAVTKHRNLATSDENGLGYLCLESTFHLRVVLMLCSTNKCQSAAETLALTRWCPMLFQQSSCLLSFNHLGPPNLWLSAIGEYIWQDKRWRVEAGLLYLRNRGLSQLYWFVFVWITTCSSRHRPFSFNVMRKKKIWNFHVYYKPTELNVHHKTEGSGWTVHFNVENSR